MSFITLCPTTNNCIQSHERNPLVDFLTLLVCDGSVQHKVIPLDVH